ncbi:flavin reductase family protein [Paraglaciecola hydrolytica]|uniref:Asp/Glu/hydantoin racemase n=1 Tax=Paraglaciecola hydrolytica TaxID=1799789 RepID=A0A148KMW4_9ALTE|nr:flavin reductase family protein [Paraglaciecola hydrolytica]KXI27630.1 Asp/Glu/hydantoin racemase [Paraglaciecola hydrolytica]
MPNSSSYFYQPKEGHGLAHDPFNSIIAPRPIGWISSQDSEGRVNLAPYSFFNAFNYHPPLIGFSSVGYKDSVRNIEQTGEFCWSLANLTLAQHMNITSQSVAAAVDEFELAALGKQTGKIVSVPFVAQSPVAMECKLSQIMQLKSATGQLCDTWLVIGEVVGVHIAQELLHDGVYQTALAEPILRGGGPGDYFSISEALKFVMPRP